MAVDNLDFLADHNIAKNGKEGEDGREGCLAIDDEEGDMVDFQPVGQVAHTTATLISMSNYYNFVATVDELLRRAVSGGTRGATHRGRTVDSW